MIEIKLTREQLTHICYLVLSDKEGLREFMESDSSKDCDVFELEKESVFLSKLLNKLEKGLKCIGIG